MSDLYLLSYNNYYNRRLRRQQTLTQYMSFIIGQPIKGVNFVPGDYLDTTQVVNWATTLANPDYILVVENNTIQSRWFVMSTMRTRAGQLRLTLHRDVMNDYYNQIINADCFIEKAIIPSSNNLIFNKEDMSFNQIKTSETLIKDASECPWICIYTASKNSDGTTTTFNINTGGSVPISRVFENEEDFNNWTVKQCVDQNKYLAGGLPDLDVVTLRGICRKNGYSIQNPAWRTYTITSDDGTANGEFDVSIDEEAKNIDKTGNLERAWSGQVVLNAFKARWDIIRAALVSFYSANPATSNLIYDNEAYESFTDEINQFVQVNTTAGPRYYKIYKETSAGFAPFTYSPKTGPSAGSIYTAIKPIIDELFDQSDLDGDACIDYKYDIDRLKKPAIEDVTASVTIAESLIPSDRYHLTDAPYDLMCMPFSDTLRITNSLSSGFVQVTASKQLALDVARAFINKYSGAGTVYDAQILPYCPLSSTIVTKSSTGVVTMNLADSTGKMYTAVKDENGNTVGYILHSSLSSFNRQITLANPVVINDYKIQNECDLYRLCSPNYNGIFEFSAAKNGGISTINIQCTYKPFTPYIKLYPTWGRLYGSNFGEDDYDARGLVCGGDFSLPATTSAWETYELQNKNYQLSFDRQIQNMEVNNSVQREREIWGIASGTLGATVQGATAGLMAAGPYGALAGLATGAASLAGGIRDLQLNDTLRKEAIDYTKDQFGYQLGNIKALPQSLSKVTAYNIDNKYFPFLEYYTCTNDEKQALANKIAFNGMTVMAIGKIVDYINNNWSYTVGGKTITSRKYIKGRLIRLAVGDYNIVNAIADEINKGVYFE